MVVDGKYGELAERALDAIKKVDIDLVQMEIPDLNGTLRGKFAAASKVADGAGSAVCTVFYQFSPTDDVWISQHGSYENGFPDVMGVPDMSTLVELPWRNGMAAVIYDVNHLDGTPFPLAPRNVLRSVAERFEDTGYQAMFGVEYEVFVFHADRELMAAGRHHELTPLGRMHNAYRLNQSEEARELGVEFIRRMRSVGIAVEVFHTELGLGAVEFALAPATAVTAADNAIRAKTYFRELCAERGLAPSFMAKWHMDDSGCGAHIHQSIWKDGQNAFYSPAEGRLSDIGLQYLAGMQATMQEFGVIFRPNINSFRRYSVAAWCPVNATWGYDHRGAALRAIIYPKPAAYRVEHRVPGADANPYLSLAAMLAGGHYGIANKLQPSSPLTGDAVDATDETRLADNLNAAMEHFDRSEICRDYFHNVFVDHYAASRRAELQHWNEWQKNQVTSYELKRYFETL